MLKRIKSHTISHYFIITLRFVVGTVFIPSGLLKFQGKRFSTICSEMYQDFFFHELHETGIYWNFLGFCQLLTAFLLFTQRYTTLAALLFTGICTNIFIFTLSANMIDKVVIMSFMMLAAILLILWDFNKFCVLFKNYNHHFDQIQNTKQPSLLMQFVGLILYIVVVVVFLVFDTYY